MYFVPGRYGRGASGLADPSASFGEYARGHGIGAWYLCSGYGMNREEYVCNTK